MENLPDSSVIKELDTVVDECINREAKIEIIVQIQQSKRNDALNDSIIDSIIDNLIIEQIANNAFSRTEDVTESVWKHDFRKYIEHLFLQTLGKKVERFKAPYVGKTVTASELAMIKTTISKINMDKYKYSPINKRLIKLINSSKSKTFAVKELLVPLGFGVLIIQNIREEIIIFEEAVVVDETVYRRNGGLGMVYYSQ